MTVLVGLCEYFARLSDMLKLAAFPLDLDRTTSLQH